MRRVRPQVQLIVTFEPFGVYGHPDHIAIGQLTLAALVAAADGRYTAAPGDPCRVQKAYYMVETRDNLARYEKVIGEPLVMGVDSEDRHAEGWPGWAITTHVDTSDYWRQAWDAAQCHKTQMLTFEAVGSLPQADLRAIWSTNTFYRALSFVTLGRAPADDLFAGLR